MARLPPRTGLQAVLNGILRTSKLHFVSVDENNRRDGAGASLVREAIEIAQRSQADLFYGHFEANGPGLERFYRELGLTLHPTGAELDFSAIFGNPGGPSPMPSERFFTSQFRRSAHSPRPRIGQRTSMISSSAMRAAWRSSSRAAR
ncbi:GNAT family N-acetyltransferase [Nocardia sp. NPDC088792]|uniref:GNAT family N-acetyltransferase n=1 Tax=Nocardia sp. NPDC088792 TaxID=3364332 RepID=UPI0037F3BECA